MFNLQGSEIIVILLLALVVLGPEKLPDAIRKFTQTYNELKKMGSGFQSEMRSALDEPMREMRQTADLIRDAADPDRFIADAEAEAEAEKKASAAAAEAERRLDEEAAASAAAAAAGVADEIDEEARRPGDVDADIEIGAESDDAAGVEPDEHAVQAADDDIHSNGALRPINEIAAANSSTRLRAVAASIDDVDLDAVPTFAGRDADQDGGEHAGGADRVATNSHVDTVRAVDSGTGPDDDTDDDTDDASDEAAAS